MTGNPTDGRATNTESTPEDTFALIGNEIRVEIIRVLGDEMILKNSNSTLSFSELRSRINIDLSPSQLNYHLQQLIGHFVEKTDGGYGIRFEGWRLYRTLQAGIFDRLEGDVTKEAGFDCHYCQAPVEARFSDASATVECPDCKYRYLTHHIPPSLETFESETATFEQFSKYIHHKLLGYARGICHTCGNAMGAELVLAEKMRDFERDRSKIYVYKLCDHCSTRFYLRVGVALLSDPELRSFCHDHGVNILSTPFWELKFAATDQYVTVRSTDPWEVALKVTYDGDTIELVIDGDLTVVKRNYIVSAEDRSKSLLSNVQSGVRTTDSKENVDEVLLPDNKDCLEYLRRHRWPDGVTCPRCDSTDTIKKGSTSKAAQRYQCKDCDSTFNDLTGTIFAEYGLSLSEMFHIIQAMDETKTAQIARQLDRSYKSVLNFVHKVQNACDEDLEVNL